MSLIFSTLYGAPEEIRTPDPQIRSLTCRSTKRARLKTANVARGGANLI